MECCLGELAAEALEVVVNWILKEIATLSQDLQLIRFDI